MNIEKEEIEISDDEEELNEDGSVRSKKEVDFKGLAFLQPCES
jgi:hypothetical protein